MRVVASVKAEYKLLARLAHPHVVKYLGLEVHRVGYTSLTVANFVLLGKISLIHGVLCKWLSMGNDISPSA